MEIGKRLIAVKSNLQHGEFDEWLKNKVDFSIRTAQRFMRIATEFPNTTLVSYLGNRKLLALAGLDEEDREEVMQENDVDKMTARNFIKVVTTFRYWQLVANLGTRKLKGMRKIS